jgi:hypothetical protein
MTAFLFVGYFTTLSAAKLELEVNTCITTVVLSWNLSTIDHCRSRCKGREGPPLIHSFIHPGISLEGLRRTMRNLNQDSMCPSQDSNLGPHEYKSRALLLC